MFPNAEPAKDMDLWWSLGLIFRNCHIAKAAVALGRRLVRTAASLVAELSKEGDQIFKLKGKLRKKTHWHGISECTVRCCCSMIFYLFSHLDSGAHVHWSQAGLGFHGCPSTKNGNWSWESEGESWKQMRIRGGPAVHGVTGGKSVAQMRSMHSHPWIDCMRGLWVEAAIGEGQVAPLGPKLAASILAYLHIFASSCI